jgi:phospholipase/carboxylesterase/glyoxalase family protein
MSDELGFIHRFIPADDPTPRETLVVLHGTGGDENDLVGIGQAIAPGASILSPRGKVLENGAPRFFKRLAEGVFDPKEVRSRAEELSRFIRAAVLKYGLDPARVSAFGYSNGANVASTIMFIEPGVLQRAILFRPMLVFEPDGTPDLSTSSILISAGRTDPIVPTHSVDRLVELLTASRADVTLKWQLAGHNLAPSEVREAADWVALQRARV